MEVSIWDIERTFSVSNKEGEANGKRKKELEEGETWRAKNVCLSIRQNRVDKTDELVYRSRLITCDYLSRSIISL